MNLKQILKFDSRKFIVALLIFSLLPIFAYKVRIMCQCVHCHCPSYIIEYASLIAIILSKEPLTLLSALHYLTVILLPTGILISYFIACLIFQKIEKLTPEDKERLQKFLRITKGKVAITVLGWLTVFHFAMHFILGIYGGLANLPPNLKNLFNLSEILATVLLPFTFLTFQILFYFNLAILAGFLYLTKLQISLGYAFHPSSLTLTGGISTIFMLILEWYLISCILVYLWSLGKQKFRLKTLCI